MGISVVIKPVQYSISVSYTHLQTLQDVVERKDKSLFAYNTSLVLLVARNYNKKVTELTTQDFQNFYQNRVNGVIEQAEEQAGLMHKTLGQEEVQYLRESANHLTTPIHLGYKEGWHSLNSDMGKVATLVLAFSSVLAIPIFGQSPKTKIKELCLATRNGKMLHYQARVIAGILLGLLIYFPSMLIFSIIRLTVLGLQGASCIIPVSYTHLDVYKRQVSCTGVDDQLSDTGNVFLQFFTTFDSKRLCLSCNTLN